MTPDEESYWWEEIVASIPGDRDQLWTALRNYAAAIRAEYLDPDKVAALVKAGEGILRTTRRTMSIDELGISSD